MKKLIVLLSLVAFAFVLQQCQHEKVTDESELMYRSEQSEISDKDNNSSAMIGNATSLSSGCFTPGNGCLWVGRTVETVPIAGCEVQVVADVWDCGEAYVFDNVDVLLPEFIEDCPKIYNWLWSINDDDSLEYSIDSLLFEATLLFEDQYIANSDLINQSGGVQATFYTMNCYRTCVYEGLTGEYGEGPIEVQRMKCGSKCCRRVTGYYIDENGNIVHTPPIYSETDGECDDNLPKYCRGRLLGNGNNCDKPCGAP